jgi:glycosyltransferase involved in cell wall biosynthesis
MIFFVQMSNDSSIPLVSIIIPVYNGSNYLHEAISSALSQSYDNIEVIVVNDGSNDDGRTEEVAKSFGDEISYFSKENGGVSTALNLGISNSKGDYISWLSHDDVYLPQKIEIQMEFLMKEQSKDPAMTITYGDCYYIDENSNIIREFRYPEVPPEKFYEALLSRIVFTSRFRYDIFGVSGCTTLIPRDAFTKCGLFREDLRAVQDYEIWFRFNTSYDFIHIGKPLIKSRVHTGQLTHELSPKLMKEGQDLYLEALKYYRRGHEKFDLNLAKTAFGLKRDPRGRPAYKKTLTMMKNSKETHGDDLYYLMRAITWNPLMGKLRWILPSGLMGLI